MRIALLADRLRIEERLLTEAFVARGHEAMLFPPSAIRIGVTQPPAVTGLSGLDGAWSDDSPPDLALDRGQATIERSALSALVSASGTPVVNRPATGRLLADRLALLRHLVSGGIPTPKTVLSFGEAATFAAIEELGFPVLLKSLTVDPSFPIGLVEDGDAAEALVEHRTTLGQEQAVLIQQFTMGPGYSVRLVIVGRELIGIERREHTGWRPLRETEYEPYSGDTSGLERMASQVVERLGSGTYAIEVVEAEGGPLVVGVGNLVDFRSLAGRSVDVAGAIADYALTQAGDAQEAESLG